MTPTAKYIAEENRLQELPQKEEPCLRHYKWGKDYVRAEEDYKNHLATRRKIPCDPSCKGLWQDQQEVVENVDYVLKEIPCPYFDHIDDPVEYTTTAFPLVPVKSEDDDRWEEAFLKLRKMGYNPAELEMHITELKKHYTLTKKQ